MRDDFDKILKNYHETNTESINHIAQSQKSCENKTVLIWESKKFIEKNQNILSIVSFFFLSN